MPRPRRLRSLAAPLATLVLAAAALTGCSSTVSMTPAPGANDPLCAQLMAQLPSTVAGQQRRWTDAQSTGAWGNPSAILFTCGVTPPGPTTLRCISLGGVDWLVDESDSPRFRLTTFGRTPAVQLYIDNTVVSPTMSSISSGVSSRVDCPRTLRARRPRRPAPNRVQGRARAISMSSEMSSA